MFLPYRIALAALLGASLLAHAADKRPSGDTGTVLLETPLFVSPDLGSQRLDRITPGRELVITEHNGPWVRVFANTDVEENRDQEAPVFGTEESATPPVSGWIQDRGIVSVGTPNGDAILFGAASQQEQNAAEAHGEQGAAQAASLLYTRVSEMFPQSPLAPEAAWRSADIRWQLQKADVFSLPSAHEKEAYLRPQIDDSAMRKIEKKYPRSRWADLAAWDLLDNKVCGDWQGAPQCPEKEAGLYEKYADEHPLSPKAPEALYDAAWREASAGDIHAGDGDDKKAAEDHAHAAAIAQKLEAKYPVSDQPGTDYAARAAALIYKVQQSIPIYGAGQE
jgi:antitoxin (DNA-binding transcriptional repressor) of toxin-antitoxin stability system